MHRHLVCILLLASLACAGCTGKNSNSNTSDDQYVTIIKGQENRIGALERDLASWSNRAKQSELDLAAANERLAILQGKNAASDGNLQLLNQLDNLDHRISRLGTASGDVSITPLPDNSGYKITIVGDVLFDSGKSDIREEGKKVLRSLVPDLSKAQGSIRIDGHTDNQQISKPETKAAYPKGNWQLGADRALNVLLFLKTEGVPEKRMFYTSWGEFNPRESNGNDEGRRRNRRVEIMVLFNQ